ASKKQTCITDSTMESEFVALAAAGKEAEWLRNLIYEIPLWPKPISPIFTHCDTEFNVESLQLKIGTHRIIPRYKTKGTTYVSTEFHRFKKLELGFYMLMKDMNTRLLCLAKVTVAETGDEAVDEDEDEIIKIDYFFKLHEVAFDFKRL
ncbi:hypothetical protein Tco_1129167, partial [Tanacetum coccineum]